MKKFTLFVLCLCAGLTFASQAQNANNPARGGMPAFIDASIENLDFGDLEVGYSQFRTFTVSGDFLVDDIYLTLEGQGMSAYQSQPKRTETEALPNHSKSFSFCSLRESRHVLINCNPL